MQKINKHLVGSNSYYGKDVPTLYMCNRNRCSKLHGQYSSVSTGKRKKGMIIKGDQVSHGVAEFYAKTKGVK